MQISNSEAFEMKSDIGSPEVSGRMVHRCLCPFGFRVASIELIKKTYDWPIRNFLIDIITSVRVLIGVV